MEALVYFVVHLVSIVITVLQFMMMIRAILSWFPIDESSQILRFVTIVTEPVIIPVRAVLDKFQFFSNLPIDLSFFVTYLLLILVSSLLPVVYF